MKRGRKYHGSWEEYNVNNGTREAISSFLKYSGVWEENQLGIGGIGRTFLGRKSRFKIMGVGKNIKLYCYRELYTPLKSGTSTRRTKKAGLLSSTILLKGGS